MTRGWAISRIKTALKRRSGKNWSVIGGTGTGWGWIRILSRPSRRIESSHMTPEDRAELASLLGLDEVHGQGVLIPASNDYYQEYVYRAAGRKPSVIGTEYWAD